MGELHVSPSETLGMTAVRLGLQAGSFRPRSTVLATRVRDGLILLDRATERYITLNHVAAEIWDRLAFAVPPATIAAQLSAEYDAPPEQILADVASQINEFLTNGLIEPDVAAETPAPSPARPDGHPPLSSIPVSRQPLPFSAVSAGVHLPSYLRCALIIMHVKLRFAVQGYERTLLWVRRRVEGVPATEQTSTETVRAAEHRVAIAAALYPGRVQCLERSFALYYLLRRRGAAVRYCQGVQPYPFQAHAWIEYRDEVINDVPEHARQFARLPEQLP